MLSALPSILTPTPSAAAAADSLGTAPRSSSSSAGGSGFAALMQRQSALRLSNQRLSDQSSADQRLAGQGPTQARSSASGSTQAPASSALPHASDSPPGSRSGAGAGSTSTAGAQPRVDAVPLAGQAAAPAPPRATAPAAAGSAGSAGSAGKSVEHSGGGVDSSLGRNLATDDAAEPATDSATDSARTSAALGDSTENRTAASLRINSKLLRVRSSAAHDASRQAAAGLAPPRANARPAAADAAALDKGSTALALSRPEDTQPAALATPDTAQPSSLLPAGPGLALLAPSALAAGSPVSTTPWPAADARHSIDAADAAGAGQRVGSLTAQGRPSHAPKPATSDAAGVLSPPDSRRSTAGWVAEQQWLREAGSSRPSQAASTAAPTDTGVATVSDLAASWPGPAAGKDATSPAPAAASASRVTTALDPARPGSSPEVADLPAEALAGPPPSASTDRSDLYPTTPGDAKPASPNGAAAAPAGAGQRGAALPGVPDRSPSEVLANPGRSNGLPDASSAGRGVRRDDSVLPASQTNTPPPVLPTGLPNGSIADTAQAADPGRSTRAAPADAAEPARSDNAARRVGDLAALDPGASASAPAPADLNRSAGLRPATAAAAPAGGLPGPSAAPAGDLAAPSGPSSAARPTSTSPAATIQGAESAVPTRPQPAPELRAAANPTNAPTVGSSALSAVQTPRWVGADPRHATEAARTAGPLASAEPAAPPPLPAATHGAGLDNGPSQHPTDSATASEAAAAALSATATTGAGAATPAAALHRNDAPSPNAGPIEARIAAPLDSPAFAPALGAQISLFARDGVQTARLQLNPAEMGPIAVQIALDGHNARIEFQADRAATREVIEASLPALAGALQDAGLTLAGGGVFQQHPGRQAPPEPGPAWANPRSQGRDTGLDAVAGGLAASSRQRAPRGLVDLVA